MQKKSEIDRIDFQPDGTMFVRIAKYLVDDDGTILNMSSDSKYHATSFVPAGQDHEATIEANNADLVKQGFGEIGPERLAILRAVIAEVHTPEVVTAYRDRVAARQAARESEIQK